MRFAGPGLLLCVGALLASSCGGRTVLITGVDGGEPGSSTGTAATNGSSTSTLATSGASTFRTSSSTGTTIRTSSSSGTTIRTSSSRITTSTSTSTWTAASTSTETSTSSSSGNSNRCKSIDGLLAYYPLDTDTLDHSGNGNNAVGSGLVPAAGKIGGAYAFDGISSSLHATGSAALSGARTLCAWVQLSPREGLGQPIFSGGATDKGDFFGVTASTPTGGTCTFLPADVPFIDHWSTPCYSEIVTDVNTGTWDLVCYAYDGADAVTFFVDGHGVTTNGAEYDYGLDTLYLGGAVTGGTTVQPSLLGTLDEVSVWTFALDSVYLSVLWNNGEGCAIR